MNKNLYLAIRTLALVFVFAISSNIFGQTADCSGPGDFSIVPTGTVAGTGTADDPYQICSNSSLTVQSNGVNPNLGLSNPGLLFFIYACDPQDTDPSEDQYDGESGCFIDIVLSLDNSPDFIIDNGIATLDPESGIWDGVGGLPTNIVIVPIIVENVSVSNGNISFDCSGIDLDYNYPHFIVSDSAVNPDCGIDPGECTVAGGTISGGGALTYCDDHNGSYEDIALSVEDNAGNIAYFITNANGDIYAGPFDLSTIMVEDMIDLEESTSLIYSVSYDEELPAFNLGDNISTLEGECVKISENFVEFSIQSFEAGEVTTDDAFDFCLTNDDDRTVNVSNDNSDSEFYGYVLVNADLEILEIIYEDGAFNFNDVTDASEFYIYGFAATYDSESILMDLIGELFVSIDNESCIKLTENFITVTVSDCDPTCIAGAGTLSTFEAYYCDVADITFQNENFNDGDDYTQVLLLTDNNLEILTVGFDVNDLNTGQAYILHAVNILTTEIPDDLIGLNALDVLGNVDCYDLESGNTFTILNPVEISVDSVECNNADSTIIATFTFSGGLAALDGSDYNVTGAVTETVDSDGALQIAVDNTAEEITIAVTDDNGCSNGVTVSLATINCVIPPGCEADAGSLSDFEAYYCNAADVSFQNEGFNDADEYTQVILLTDDNLEIQSVGLDVDDLNTEQAYILHALNILTTEVPDELIGLNALDVLGNVECYDLTSGNTFTVLNPITISVEDLECNDADETITATFTISGGLPELDGSTSYSVMGAVTETVDSDGNLQVEVDNTVESITIVVTDDNGCETETMVALANVCIPGCEADAGLVSESSAFYCTSVTISPNVLGFNNSDDYAQVYILTDDVLNILDIDTDASFDLLPGSYLFHSLNLAVAEAPSDLEALIGLNAQDVLADLNCFSLESSNLITVLETIEYSIENVGCNETTGLYDLVLNISGGLPAFDDNTNYIISGDISENVGADGVLEFSVEPSSNLEFAISDDEGCTMVAQYQVLDCSDLCDSLVSGILSTDSQTTICTMGDDFEDIVLVDLTGNQSSNFDYFITDDAGNILDGPFDGPTFSFEGAPAGECQIFGVAYEGVLDFTVGELIFDVSASGCVSITNSIVITRTVCYEEITIDNLIFDIEEATGTYTFTFDVSGGSGDYSGTNGTFDGTIFNSISFNCGEGTTITITDSVGNMGVFPITAPCEIDCPGESEAGNLSVNANLLCANSNITVGATGFNAGADYTQLYVATTGNDYSIAAVSTNGIFEGLASGTYQMHALNYYNPNAPVLPNIGESAANILNQTNACFDLDVNAALTVTIMNPIEAVIDYSCNGETGIYTLTFSFRGGMPQYVAENGSVGIAGETLYTVSGDLNGNYTYGQNIVIDYSENTSYSMSFFDVYGCVGVASGTPAPCSKTAVELLVFEGEAKLEANHLFWSTATEYNSDYFIVEKSKDGIIWEQIVSKLAAVNSNHTINYDYIDTKNVSGVSYYRLISIDLDGKSSLSEVITVRNEKAGFEVASVYPIPAQNNLNVNIYLSEIQLLKVNLFSFDGKVIKQQTYETNKGSNSLSLDITDLPVGIYWIQISGNTESFTQKIIKAL